MANLQDTFIRGAGETTPFALQNHTSNSGATWKNQSTTGALVLTTANSVVDSGTGTDIWYSVTGGTGVPATTDYGVGANLIFTAPLNGNVGLALHVDTTGGVTGYIAAFITGPGWCIYRINAGTYTPLASYGSSVAPGTVAISATIKTNANDVTITLSVAGTVLVTAVDTSPSRITSGPAGLYGYNIAGGGVAFGNFTAQDTTAAVVTPPPPTGLSVYADSATLRYSPGNWQPSGAGTTAKAASVNPGAYLKQYFANATSLTINFDASLNAGQSAVQIPMIAVRFDGGAWQYFPVAATITPVLPPSRAQYRLLEVAFSGVYTLLERWAVGASALAPLGSIVFAGLTYNTGATTALVPARKYKILVLGDSIVEGVNSNAGVGSGANSDNNAVLSWAFGLQAACNAEVGCVGFSGQAVTNTSYSGTLPVAPTTYNSLWNGAPRSFAGLDAVVLEWGTNDGGADAAMVTGLTAIGNGIKAANGAVKLLLLKNYFDRVSASITTAAANVGGTVEGGLVNIMNLALDSVDSNHPTAAAAQTKYVPTVAQAVNALLSPGGPVTIPTGTLPVGLSLFKFVSPTADNIANYLGLGIIWTVPDAGSWVSGKPGGPSFQAVTQFVPGNKYYVLNTSTAPISLYGAQL